MSRNTGVGLLIAPLVVSSLVTWAGCKHSTQDEQVILEARALQAEARKLRAAELAAGQECAARDEEREAEMNRLMASLAELKEEQDRLKKLQATYDADLAKCQQLGKEALALADDCLAEDKKDTKKRPGR